IGCLIFAKRIMNVRRDPFIGTRLRVALSVFENCSEVNSHFRQWSGGWGVRQDGCGWRLCCEGFMMGDGIFGWRHCNRRKY
ncbi:MAG: hypothetical protein II276_00860, partial [Bacteroidales bacterium]|nr:hypothetical protein [Bacteroidales bacterium]